MEAETLEQMQARHRKELKDLQGRITNKKKNATKKTRKGVNDECVEMERQVKDRQAAEVAVLGGGGEAQGEDEEEEKVEEEEDELNGTLGLEDATAKLQLEEGGSRQEQQQQPGKKRNRQKDRLARRAADQEAAMQRAEEEAASMTDHRARESAYMKKAFAAHNLVEKDINPDGHCLFSAVADQLGQNAIPLGGGEEGEPAYRTVRRAAAEYMSGHVDDFAPFLEEDFEGYVEKMRDTAEWGGQLELMALARRYAVTIRVIQDGRTETIGDEGNAEEEGQGKMLWLAYYRHGYGLGEHYNSLRKATATTTTTTTTTTATTAG